MNRRVVDASVVAAALLVEELEGQAWSILASEDSLLAPELIVAEFGNAVWKRFRRQEIDEAQSTELLTDFHRLPLRLTRLSKLIGPALQIAMQYDRTVYDSLYVALAVHTDTAMITADKRLVNALAGGPHEKYVQWLGAIK